MADWGHELGVGLCQGLQARSVWKRDGIHGLDLPTNEGEQLIHEVLSSAPFYKKMKEAKGLSLF